MTGLGAPNLGVEFGVGPKSGAVILYTTKEHKGESVDMWLHGKLKKQVHASVVEKTVDGRTAYVAVFPCVPAGNHLLAPTSSKLDAEITVYAGRVSEVDKS